MLPPLLLIWLHVLLVARHKRGPEPGLALHSCITLPTTECSATAWLPMLVLLVLVLALMAVLLVLHVAMRW